MVVIIGDEGVISEGVLSVIGDNVVKGGGNFEGIVKASVALSTAINGDCELNFAWTFFPSITPYKLTDLSLGG